jgi:O-antigen ligase
MERSSPAPVFGFLALLLANLVFMSSARGAIILLIGYLVAGGAIYLIWRLRMRENGAHPLVSTLVAVGAAALVAGAAWLLNLNKSFDEIRLLAETGNADSSLQSRVVARQATLDLFKAEPVTGWGAGSFRHAFPIYQRNYESIYRGYGGLTLAWDNAHNDYLQALAELGAAGFSLLVLMLVWALVKFCVAGGLGQPAFLLFGAGACLPLIHAWFDFPLVNCAILTTLCAAWVLLLRWIELEQNR